MTADMKYQLGSLLGELEELAKHLRAFTVRVQTGRFGVGSGIIWRSSGLVVTNAHVVPKPDARVWLADGRELAGTIRARDLDHDLAVVSVNARNLPSVKIGDVNALLVGQLVFAMGNPRYLAGALRIGIIHSFSNALPSAGRRRIQADIDLSPGYSGGPLSDAAGRVIGVNSTATRDGRGFAVPSNTVEKFLRDVRAD